MDNVFFMVKDGTVKVTPAEELPPIPKPIKLACEVVDAVYNISECDLNELSPSDADFLNLCMCQSLNKIEGVKDILNSNYPKTVSILSEVLGVVDMLNENVDMIQSMGPLERQHFDS